MKDLHTTEAGDVCGGVFSRSGGSVGGRRGLAPAPLEETMSTRTAIVTGGSRGFGCATALALVKAGVHVIGVARDRERLDAVRDEAGAEFTPVAADAADPVTAGRLVDTYRPDILVLNAGAHPLLRPLHKYSWETFSSNWEVDVRHVFNWTREALLPPLNPGSVVVTVSIRAALATGTEFDSGAYRVPANGLTPVD